MTLERTDLPEKRTLQRKAQIDVAFSHRAVKH